MFSGHNFIGFTQSKKNKKAIKAFSTLQGGLLPEEFAVANSDEIEEAVLKAETAFEVYKKTSFEERAIFLEAIAAEIAAIGEALIQRAMLESGLPEARLLGERGRTIGQLKLFAEILFHLTG